MVLVEDRLGLGDVLLDLRLLAPGQAEQHVEIVAADGRLGRHRRHRLQLLHLGGRLRARLLRKLGLGDLAGELGELVALPFLALVAELALDRLQLLVEIIFALGLLHLALDPASDLLLDLEHSQLALHEGEHHLQPPDRVELGEQRLLVGHLDVDVGGDRIGELRGLLDLAELDRGLGRKLAVQLRIILELLDHRAHQRRDLGALPARRSRSDRSRRRDAGPPSPSRRGWRAAGPRPAPGRCRRAASAAAARWRPRPCRRARRGRDRPRPDRAARRGRSACPPPSRSPAPPPICRGRRRAERSSAGRRRCREGEGRDRSGSSKLHMRALGAFLQPIWGPPPRHQCEWRPVAHPPPPGPESAGRLPLFRSSSNMANLPRAVTGTEAATIETQAPGPRHEAATGLD